MNRAAAQHPQRVVAEADLRRQRGAQHAVDQVDRAAERIDERRAASAGQLERHRVDREVAPRQVGLDAVGERDIGLARVVVVHLGAVGGDLVRRRSPLLGADRAERARPASRSRRPSRARQALIWPGRASVVRSRSSPAVSTSPSSRSRTVAADEVQPVAGGGEALGERGHLGEHGGNRSGTTPGRLGRHALGRPQRRSGHRGSRHRAYGPDPWVARRARARLGVTVVCPEVTGGRPRRRVRPPSRRNLVTRASQAAIWSPTFRSLSRRWVTRSAECVGRREPVAASSLHAWSSRASACATVTGPVGSTGPPVSDHTALRDAELPHGVGRGLVPGDRPGTSPASWPSGGNGGRTDAVAAEGPSQVLRCRSAAVTSLRRDASSGVLTTSGSGHRRRHEPQFTGRAFHRRPTASQPSVGRRYGRPRRGPAGASPGRRWRSSARRARAIRSPARARRRSR